MTAEMARDAGASIIVITDKPSSLLAQYADILLTVPVDSNTFFNSMIGPQFVTESLLEIISHKAKGIEKRLNTIDKYLNKLGNYHVKYPLIYDPHIKRTPNIIHCS